LYLIFQAYMTTPILILAESREAVTSSEQDWRRTTDRASGIARHWRVNSNQATSLFSKKICNGAGVDDTQKGERDAVDAPSLLRRA
jgi:hypothetical protein